MTIHAHHHDEARGLAKHVQAVICRFGALILEDVEMGTGMSVEVMTKICSLSFVKSEQKCHLIDERTSGQTVEWMRGRIDKLFNW